MSELAIEPVDPYDDDEAALRHEAYEVQVNEELGFRAVARMGESQKRRSD